MSGGTYPIPIPIPDPMPGPTLDARRARLGSPKWDGYGVIGGAEGTRAGGPKPPPPVLSVRPRVVKPPSSTRAGNWLSDRGELSYELGYPVAGGGMPVGLKPGGESKPWKECCSLLPMGYEALMPLGGGGWNGCGIEDGGGTEL